MSIQTEEVSRMTFTGNGLTATVESGKGGTFSLRIWGGIAYISIDDKSEARGIHKLLDRYFRERANEGEVT